MGVVDHICAEGLAFRANTPEHCNAVATMTRQGHESIYGVIAKGLDRAWTLPELGANDISAAGGYSGSHFDCNASGSESAFGVSDRLLVG